MSVQTPALDRLRSEYRSVGDHLALLKRNGGADGPDALRLVAREMEIVDLVTAAGLSPDVLVKA